MTARAKMDYALGMSYDQLKENKNAIDAYGKAFDMEPDNLDAERGLAQALLNDNQLSAALKHFEAISVADPQDAQTYRGSRRSSGGRATTSRRWPR